MPALKAAETRPELFNRAKRGTKAAVPLQESMPAKFNQITFMVQRLQRNYGNAYVQRLVRQATPAEANQGHLADSPLVRAAENENRTADAYTVTAEIATRIDSKRDSGRPLNAATRDEMEANLGQQLGDVRVHTDSEADQLNRDVDAEAFTSGNDIFFRGGNYAPKSTWGKGLLAHELTHVVGQQSAGNRVQRYESGEHAQMGETQAELKAALKAELPPANYTVHKGDTLRAIAKKFGVTVAELKDANKDKLKKWPATDGSGRMIEGFNAGETVSIPQQLNDIAKAASKDKSAKFTVNGVVLDYGVGIAMGDFFESPEQMAKASPKELNELAALIRREQSGGKPVTTEEWQKATGGRYLKLAEKNEAHFAPPSAGRVTPSAAGAKSANHQSEWEKHHAAALRISQAGDKDKALMTNAFADHFLTDAFAAGHLVNKRDVMELFKSQLKLDAKGKEFTKSSKVFFDEVAKDAFTGSVRTEFSKYQTVKTYFGFHADIDRVSRFSSLLQGVHKKKPDVLANAVAKGLHDNLNLGGLPVENARGDSWPLSGDKSLNAKTRTIARQAVAQSQLNVILAYNFVGPLNYSDLYKRVWDYTPKPSKPGATLLVDKVQKGTDVKSAGLKAAVVKLINDNYEIMIDVLVNQEKELQEIK